MAPVRARRARTSGRVGGRYSTIVTTHLVYVVRILCVSGSPGTIFALHRAGQVQQVARRLSCGSGGRETGRMACRLLRRWAAVGLLRWRRRPWCRWSPVGVLGPSACAGPRRLRRLDGLCAGRRLLRTCAVEGRVVLGGVVSLGVRWAGGLLGACVGEGG